MKLNNNYLRLSSIAVLLAVTISMAAPSAFAMPGLSTGNLPPIPVQGQTVTLTWGGNVGSAPHLDVSFRVYEAGLTPTVPADKLVFVNPCTTDMPGAVASGSTVVNGLRVWELRHGAVTAQFKILAAGDVLGVTFGNGATAQTITYNGGALPAANVDDAGVGAYHWEQIADSPSPGTRDDNTSLLTSGTELYMVIDCGQETASLPAFFDGHSFGTQEPVGGEILSINTAALLIAGINANQYSILGALTMLGAVSFGILFYTAKRQKQ